jgi:hypothetical protein
MYGQVPFERKADEGRMNQWKRLREMDASAQLKCMMGDSAEF